MIQVTLWAVLAPLIGAVIAGIGGRAIGRVGAHRVTIVLVAISTILSIIAWYRIVVAGHPPIDHTLYLWGVVGDLEIPIGFLIDELSVTMMVIVTSVSLMVHIYTIGYMKDDPGYQRFFSYISLFTFAMLTLVMSNNFIQLFFGWEAVGVVSYLLIGFWFDRESAIRANLKAFLVNRVGDFGFLLGIACLLAFTGSLRYDEVFAMAPALQGQTISLPLTGGAEWSVLTVACLCLFIGAMGKSAQFPLHVWLPDSMEGPTPISALIHAATMVTAGIFMVARMSPLFELSETALSTMLIIGAITALFMGLLGLVQHDIKRVVAYSTLSQLGYMTTGLGASAYAASIFHLGTHAFFKALLFLGAGSVIIAMHHEQDMRRMGGLKRYMPITWITALIGTLALIGTPGFAGFFSKESLIEAVHHSQLPGSTFAWVCILAGVFVTALYSFRMYFLVFHGKERMDEHTRSHLRESPAVVTIPLIFLAIASLLAGGLFAESILYGTFFGQSMMVMPEHDVLGEMAPAWGGAGAMMLHSFVTAPFWLAVLGVVVAWYLWLHRPDLPARIAARFSSLHNLLIHKYHFDDLYENILTALGRRIGSGLWRVGDMRLIDGLLVNGSAFSVGRLAKVIRKIQSGFLYHYAFAMIIGLVLLVSFFVIVRL
ncbi:NADH-quinone oxidoreductase subunit L [Thioalkalivibrio sp. HK1]|uniref:NADH-quinone oxidoreductase subunit L n=1 Tax=Thioalkalivibrio sp. HK1 TaxID=1469245 RepID=UPI00046FE991|nr:NADH-quinone oxidoreductase subunit L [Thioalkalivibrio sp. HK1]